MGTALDRVRAAQAVNDAAAMAAKQRLGVAPCRASRSPRGPSPSVPAVVRPRGLRQLKYSSGLSPHRFILVPHNLK